jgi:adenine phosphoribosyltransferase
VDLREFVRDVPDFPEPGILFRDITPLLGNADAFRQALAELGAAAASAKPEVIAGIESRGFIFGAPIAERLGLPFVPVRKPGKLPGARMSVEYALEYGAGQLDIHADGFERGARVFIIDDLLATGGTARAAAELVELCGGHVCGLGFAIELEALNGRALLAEFEIHALMRC